MATSKLQSDCLTEYALNLGDKKKRRELPLTYFTNHPLYIHTKYKTKTVYSLVNLLGKNNCYQVFKTKL